MRLLENPAVAARVALMNIAEGVRRVQRATARPDRFTEGREYLLVLGHMRSGSSMLTNVLRTHPEIAGSHELHKIYKRPDDFADIPIALRRFESEKVDSAHFFLDKVLHSAWLPDPAVLAEIPVRCIFLLREPVSSISSMARRLVGMPLHERPDLAAAHYEQRLAALSQYAYYLPEGSAAFIDYRDLTDNTDRALEFLTDFLNLSSPLTREYVVDDRTGKWRMGDASEHIRSGEIQQVKSDHGIEIPEYWRTRAERCYLRTTDELSTMTRSIATF